MNKLDWNLVHSFLLVAKLGSLSAAARQLGVSQPTLSRDIQALELAAQLNLFNRSPQGLNLTDAGRSLVDAASRMDAAADLFARQASGLTTDLQGEVRISANEIVGIHLLPPAIAAFRNPHPSVQIEIAITNRVSNLSKREADIALRMFRPTQPDLVAKRLPDMALGFYAHERYLAQYGEPQTIEQFTQHSIIGFDESMDFIDGAAQMGFQFVRDNFALRTDHLLAQLSLCRAGAGIIGTHVGLAQNWQELKRILQWVPLPALEFWIVYHRDVRFNARVHALVQFLVEWFAEDPYRYAVL